ncbi:MAG: hypothetical protein PHX70_05860 [Clostridium sp.]|nr:hypothetical protein [Clostridium sp.]
MIINYPRYLLVPNFEIVDICEDEDENEYHENMRTCEEGSANIYEHIDKEYAKFETEKY